VKPLTFWAFCICLGLFSLPLLYFSLLALSWVLGMALHGLVLVLLIWAEILS
jgi:hypothetical protein